MGSIPVRVTTKNSDAFASEFFVLSEDGNRTHQNADSRTGHTKERVKISGKDSRMFFRCAAVEENRNRSSENDFSR